MSESNDAIVITSGLTKIFKDFWLREKVTAVADLDLEILPREVFGLLGPNGSGKSTALKMILGLLFPTRGRIAVFGRRPTDVQTKARIGFLPEESYLYPFLDARETLDFYGRLFHQNRQERRRRVDMLLDMVGLASVSHRRIGEYSKGMQRRIGLAQALINDPDLLIVDEPTSGMDPIGTRQFKDLIVALARRGKTVILSSHLLGDVEDVCDRVCILYGGRQQALGGVDELLSQKSYTQLTTDRLDEDTLQRVSAVLAGAGRELRQVAAPRQKLEDLFLSIVKTAQESRLATGGATSGGGVADFLRAKDGQEDQAHSGQEVIADLLAPEKVAAEATDAQDEALDPLPPTGPADDVIDSLVTAAVDTDTDEQAAEADRQAQAHSEASRRQADRGVIDGLLASKPPAGEVDPDEPTEADTQ